MTEQYPGDKRPDEDFVQIGEDDALRKDLEPRKTWRIAPFTAILGAVVLLAAGVTGGVVAHASLAGDDNNTQATNGPGRFQGGGFRGQNGENPPSGAPGNGGNATIGTVESVSGTTMKVKRQDGTEVTVTLTDDTDIQVTKKGAATDLAKGSTVVVTGTGDGTSVTAESIREGDMFGGRRPGATPSPTG